MSEMTDRVAAALREAVGGNLHMNFDGVARHVITSMRAPTEGMINAGREVDNSNTLAVEVWQAMIDEALK